MAFLCFQCAAESFLQFLQDKIARYGVSAMLRKDLVDTSCVGDALFCCQASVRVEFDGAAAQFGSLAVVSISVLCSAWLTYLVELLSNPLTQIIIVFFGRAVGHVCRAVRLEWRYALRYLAKTDCLAEWLQGVGGLKVEKSRSE